jgi:hypothetical protein
MFGGALGLASPIPGGAYAGAGIGAATGKALENVVEKYLLDEPKDRTDIYVSPITEGLSGAAGEMGGALTGKYIVPPVISAGKKVIGGLKSTTSSLSKIPSKVMETYYKRAPEVAKIGTMEETSLIDAANELRQQTAKRIDAFKYVQNQKIYKGIENAVADPVSIDSTLKSLEEGLQKLNPRTQFDQVARVEKEINLLKEMQYEGTTTVFDAYGFKQKLQNLADYTEKGELKKKKDFADLIFKRAASRINSEIGKVAPLIKEGEKELSKLRRLGSNRTFNRNLITPDAPYGSVVAVGTGENQQAINQIKKLEDIIGFPYKEKAENIAAAYYMNKAGILPKEKTGSSAIPLLVGGSEAVRQAFQGNLPGTIGAMAIGSLASPIAIKGGILAGRQASKTAPFITEAINQSISRAIQMGMPAHLIDQQVRDSDMLKPTEKAELRKKLVK